MKLTSLLLTAALFFATSAFSHEKLETDNWQDVVNKVQALNETYAKEEILVVFDLDNTLLAGKSDLGSTQWFSWQSDLLKAGTTEGLVASDFDGLLEVQHTLFQAGSMIPAAENTAEAVAELKALSGNSIILTSRGPYYRDVSMRDLRVAGIDFSDSGIPATINAAYSYTPLDDDKVSRLNLTEEQIQAFKLYRSRQVSYSSGVYMTAGQHKGAMLQLLLNKVDKEYKAVVFVDDSVKHTDGMHLFFEGRDDLELVTYRFSAQDERVKAFNESDKTTMIEGWNSIKAAFEKSL